MGSSESREETSKKRKAESDEVLYFKSKKSKIAENFATVAVSRPIDTLIKYINAIAPTMKQTDLFSTLTNEEAKLIVVHKGFGFLLDNAMTIDFDTKEELDIRKSLSFGWTRDKEKRNYKKVTIHTPDKTSLTNLDTFLMYVRRAGLHYDETRFLSFVVYLKNVHGVSLHGVLDKIALVAELNKDSTSFFSKLPMDLIYRNLAPYIVNKDETQPLEIAETDMKQFDCGEIDRQMKKIARLPYRKNDHVKEQSSLMHFCRPYLLKVKKEANKEGETKEAIKEEEDKDKEKGESIEEDEEGEGEDEDEDEDEDEEPIKDIEMGETKIVVTSHLHYLVLHSIKIQSYVRQKDPWEDLYEYSYDLVLTGKAILDNSEKGQICTFELKESAVYDELDDLKTENFGANRMFGSERFCIYRKKLVVKNSDGAIVLCLNRCFDARFNDMKIAAFGYFLIE